jgi:hypothetical protein
MATKKLKRPAHVWLLYKAVINGRKLIAYVTAYKRGRRGYRIFDGSKLIEEVGGIYDDGQGSGSYKMPNLKLREMARVLIIDSPLAAYAQSITCQHEMFGFYSVKSSVLKLANGTIGWQLEVIQQGLGDESPMTTVTCGEETCGDSPEGWTRIARAAGLAWRDEAIKRVMY